MAKIQYPVTENYVPDWTLGQAIREVIANALDAEVETGAKFSYVYDVKKETLTVSNADVMLKPEALYFGESTKRGHDAYIGQYGEGLKIALLVFARHGLAVKIRNGATETWTPSIQADKHGMRCLTVDITKANRSNNDLDVVIPSLTSESWEIIRSWFLKLNKPKDVLKTSVGEILNDPEHVGKLYVKGVYVCSRERYTCGYNFFHVDTGRDRRIPSNWEMDSAIARMWAEVCTQNKAGKQLYQAFEHDTAETEVFQYAPPENVVKAVLKGFREAHGDKAVPVLGIHEGSDLEHFGMHAVPMPKRMVELLRRELPAPAELVKQLGRSVSRRYTMAELDEEERAHLARVRSLLLPHVDAFDARVTVVDFQDPSVQGLANDDRTIMLARRELRNAVRALTILIHEFAHDAGGDGSPEHVQAIHRLQADVLEDLFKRCFAASE